MGHASTRSAAQEHSLCILLAVVHRWHGAAPDGHAPRRRPPAAGTLARPTPGAASIDNPSVQTTEQGGDRG